MTSGTREFFDQFALLTGHPPHSWQERLHREWFAEGKIPKSIALPTGTGKTSIMALWLLAVAQGAALPRRLVWVVDRRVVVDQATEEARKLRSHLDSPELAEVRASLGRLSVSGSDGGDPLAISALRGALEDNQEWSRDPSRPAIIVGTVDMVGSRLLFSGYGDGKYRRPQHAGLLGRDSLVVLDEAHLSRPFESTLRQIEDLQADSTGGLPPFRFLPVSATSRPEGPFTLVPAEREGTGLLAQILQAPKHLIWHGDEGAQLPAEEFVNAVVEAALKYSPRTARVVIYLDRLADVDHVVKRLSRAAPGRLAVLTGTLRGHERDRLTRDPNFARFLERADRGTGVAYLVSTSAGEVGIDLYADHMVSDLVPCDRMIQRFGRVNRAGDAEATIDICPKAEASVPDMREGSRRRTSRPRTHGDNDPVERTRAYLQALPGVSPGEIDSSPPPSEALTPPPANPPLRAWLVDAWSLTASARPDLPVANWLRGLDAGSPPTSTSLGGTRRRSWPTLLFSMSKRLRRF